MDGASRSAHVYDIQCAPPKLSPMRRRCSEVVSARLPI